MREVTLDQLDELRLEGMKRALKEQLGTPSLLGLSFDERFELLVDAETVHRSERRLATRIQKAGLRQSARLEEIDHRTVSSLHRPLLEALGTCRWLKEKRNVLVVGPTGVGKTFLASALTLRGCQEGFSARFFRAPRLLHDLEIGRADGTYRNRLASIARVDLLILDDWLIAPLADVNRRDLLEILDDRYDRRSTMVCSQLPVENWHDAVGDPTLADAILDRLVHNAYRLDMQGESLRKARGIPQDSDGMLDQYPKA